MYPQTPAGFYGAPDISASKYDVYLEPGETGQVTIYFDSPTYFSPPYSRPVGIWFRIDLGPWQRMLLEKVEGKDKFSRGHFESEILKPGRVLQYRIFSDPNRTPDEDYERDYGMRGYPIGSQTIMILGLLKKPIKTHWKYDHKEVPGGTFCSHQFWTPDVKTTVRVRVSTHAPADPLDRAEFEAYRIFGLQAQMNVEPLQPGTLYDRVVRYSDASGDWWDETDTFTTLQRVVTLTADSIHVINDGDPAGMGEASFMIMFYKDRIPTDAFFLGGDDYKVTTGQDIELDDLARFDFSAPWQFPFSEHGPAQRVYGPESVTTATSRIGIGASGTDYDGWLESDEEATTEVDTYGGVTFLAIPNGSDETVFEASGSIEAKSFGDDDFKFRVHYRYSVTYV